MSSGTRFFSDKARAATCLGIAAYAGVTLLFLVLGQVNGDEGWYLYASKRVFMGELPYRDFAYTQLPLSPYIYGVLQIVHPSILLGRLVSILLSLGTLLMAIVVARRYGGARAGGFTALLIASFTYGIYYGSIVKTYALLSFFFVATLFVLSSDWDEIARYALALVFVLAATFVRITAIFFALPLLFYLFFTASRFKTRALLLFESGLAALGMAFFLLPNWAAARWGLVDSHMRHWADAPLTSRLVQILADRLPDIIQYFGPVLLLFAACIYFIMARKSAGDFLSTHLPLAVVTFGLGLFATAHFVNGLWDVEYVVPAVTAFLPILAVMLNQVYESLEKSSRVFVQGTLVATLLLLPFAESTQHIDISGKRLPFSEIDSIAAVVAQRTRPADVIVALEVLNAVVDADRSVLPGLALGQFSVQPVDTETALDLHVVNVEMLVASVAERATRMVILTDRDWDLLSATDLENTEELGQVLDSSYDLVLTVPQYGGYSNTASVYVRR